jgi:mitochondrial enoyl-[acyl-carrier protein] reductase / trans-2-enoyl-CoA reductase
VGRKRLLISMQAAQLDAFGPARDVLHLVDVPMPELGEGQLLLEMLFSSVNPADLNIIEGKYGELPAMRSLIGNEGVGRVAGLGVGVTDFAMGDLVLPMRTGAWAQYMVADVAEAIRLPAAVDPLQASMLTVNPPSAWAMLEQFVSLKAGDWLVQNAANSAVGRCVIQLAKARGVKTLNVVRRPELIEELKGIGADIVVTEECDLRSEIGQLCGETRPVLALNAVGGASALNLANGLADGGTLVTYGAMGRQPLKIPNGLLIFRRLEFKGFWLREWMRSTSQTEKQRILASLAELSVAGALQLPVHRVYPLAELHAALEEAGRGSRTGKVLMDLRQA